MIVANLVGGIGNQMFQYANAKNLSEKLSLPLYFTNDINSFYSKENKNLFQSIFNLKLNYIDKSIFINNFGMFYTNKYLRFVLSKIPNSFSIPKNLHFEPSIIKYQSLIERVSLTKGGYIHGYWQSELYFKEISSIIKDDFIFENISDNENLTTLIEIKKHNSIGVHIRRGDYYKSKIHQICSKSYYINSMKYFIQNTKNPLFFIFSDDPTWVKNNIIQDFGNSILVLNNQNKNHYIDMQLMSNCKHNIISNSSFSWWAAWLNANNNKIIISPRYWYKNIYVADLIPTNWLLFDNLD